MPETKQTKKSVTADKKSAAPKSTTAAKKNVTVKNDTTKKKVPAQKSTAAEKKGATKKVAAPKKVHEAKKEKEKTSVKTAEKKAPAKKTSAQAKTQKADTKKESKTLTYKGRPLSRLGNTIFYGDPKEKYILKLVILESEKRKDLKNLEMGTKVSVEVLNSANHSICKKSTTKSNLYHALDIGQIWLNKMLKDGEGSAESL